LAKSGKEYRFLGIVIRQCPILTIFFLFGLHQFINNRKEITKFKTKISIKRRNACMYCILVYLIRIKS
jgi:hypothetical protein